MYAPIPASNTLNGNAFKSQGNPFEEFSSPPVLPVSFKRTEGVTLEMTIDSINSIKEKLLGLSSIDQQLVRAVRKMPGCDSLAIGNATYVTRFTALAHLSRLVEEIGVLESDKNERDRKGTKKAIHFWLARDIPAELVDAVLGDAELNADAMALAASRQAHPNIPTHLPDLTQLSPMEILTILPSWGRELVLAVADAGEAGISVAELAQATGQRDNKIYERLPQLVEKGLICKQVVPGFKHKSLYVPSEILLEIISQLPSDEETDTNANTDENIKESPVMLPEVTPSPSVEVPHPDITAEIPIMLDILKELVKRVRTLEGKFARIESNLQDKNQVLARDILDMLHSDDEFF